MSDFNTELPEIKEIEEELFKEKYKAKYKQSVKSTVFTLITVAAVAVLVATLWLPVLQIYGGSMTPSLEDGEIVVSSKSGEFETGDIIAFYYNNKVLVKRVIATSGQWVNIDEKGNVSVNGSVLVEPYITDKCRGDYDIELPYQVPENRIFVMGDHRGASMDSRNTIVGCVAEEQIVGLLPTLPWQAHYCLLSAMLL